MEQHKDFILLTLIPFYKKKIDETLFSSSRQPN